MQYKLDSFYLVTNYIHATVTIRNCFYFFAVKFRPPTNTLLSEFYRHFYIHMRTHAAHTQHSYIYTYVLIHFIAIEWFVYIPRKLAMNMGNSYFWSKV